ncbi:DUF927 domain-containing protein [Domibacillus tundrae]|uniref:phage NrS-1 polymerase family protein n=1 Tax=Domibacillus tundrae TaxID=1587527 RepID=UPI0006969C15|nr:DUF927 domain-containing protein [Domibacillus tundrae]
MAALREGIEKPDPLRPRFERIPAELRKLNSWVLWRYQPNGNKWTKVLKQINGRNASVDKPETWTSFEAVQIAYNGGRFDGIGFVFSSDNEYAGIDIDGVVKDGQMSHEDEQAARFADMVHSLSYTELSPSGSGLHVIFRTPLHMEKGRKKSGKEIYTHNRFFTFTGHVFGGMDEIHDVAEETLTGLLETYFGQAQSEASSVDVEAWEKERDPQPIDDVPDAQLWKTMFGCLELIIANNRFPAQIGQRKGDVIRALHDGTATERFYDGDDSSADQALMNYLARFTLMNVPRMKAMFEQSALSQRDKWRKRTDYQVRTIREAFKGAQEVLKDPPHLDFNDEKGGESARLVHIPEPFRVIRDELYRVEYKRRGEKIEEVQHHIAYCVPTVTRSFFNYETDSLFYEIAWKSKDRTRKRTVPASWLATKRELVKLSDGGMNVNDNNAKYFVDYFSAFIGRNQIPQEQAVDRLGYAAGGGFVHPATAKENGFEVIDQGDAGADQQLLDAFQPKGSLEMWKQNVLEPIKKHPRAMFMLSSSFASVILSDLGLDPIIVDNSAVTSQGKSVLLRACASVWGSRQLVNEFNATANAVERKAAYLQNFPAIFDDTKKANPIWMETIVYNFSGGRSKGRASIRGMQKEYTWRNILLSNGEHSILEFAKGGGATARAISIVGRPFEPELTSEERSLICDEDGMENHYGHAGLVFLAYWQANKITLKKQFKSVESHYRELAGDNDVLSRIARHFAAVVFAAAVMTKALNVRIDGHAFDQVFQDMAEENESLDKPKQWMNTLLTDLDADRNAIFYDYEPRVKTKAVFYKGTIGFTPAYLKEMLGADEKMIRQEWMNRGMTVRSTRDGKPVDYKPVKVAGRMMRIVLVNTEILGSSGFDFSKHETNSTEDDFSVLE